MFVIIGRGKLEKMLADVQADALKQVEQDMQGIKSVADLSGRVKTLRADVEKLEMEKARKEEEFARKEREVEHKVGLERKRQAFELESGKKEAVLQVREENLKADRERFAEQMEFNNTRFTEEVGYLKDMIGQVLERVPNISADFTPAPAKRR